MRRSTTKHLWLAGSLALLAALLPARVAEAEVRIPGYGENADKTLSLKEIDDIVLWTTGRRNWPKDSFIECVTQPANQGGPLRIYPSRRDGEKGDWGKGGIDKHDLGTESNPEKWPSRDFGLHTAVSAFRRRDSAGKDQGLTVMWPVGDGSKLQFARVKMNDKFELVATQQDFVWDLRDTNVVLMDAAGGLFPKGEYDEDEWFPDLFVAAYKRGDNSPIVAFADPETKRSTSYQLSGSLKDKAVLRVAVGDLDGDGKANEIAVIYGQGNEETYQLAIYRVQEDWKNHSWTKLYETKVGTRKSGQFDGCDVMVGDFDGDGKQELAVVCTDMRESLTNKRSYPSLFVYKHADGDSWRQAAHLYFDDNKDRWLLGNTTDRNDVNYHHNLFGMIGEAGDLDGDGRDEIVLLAPRYVNNSNAIDFAKHGGLMLGVFEMNGSNLVFRSDKLVFDRDAGQTEYAAYLDDHLLKRASLALPFSGDPSLQGGRDILVSSRVNENDRHTVRRLTYKNKRLSGAVDVDVPKNVECVKLLAADFYYETLDLDNPVHMVFEDELCPVAVVQAQPFHVDYVQATDEVLGYKRPSMESPDVVNMTHKPDAKVTYSKTKSTSTETDLTFGLEGSFEFKGEGHWGVMVDSVLGAQLKLEGSLMGDGMYENTKNSFAKETFEMDVPAQTGDVVVQIKADRHIWRYQLLNPVQSGDEVPEGELSGERYMTLSLCDTPSYKGHSGGGGHVQDDTYAPSHEEGNLFSYPVKISFDPQPDAPEFKSAGDYNVADGASSTMAIESSETNTSKLSGQLVGEATGSFVGNLGIPDLGLGGDLLGTGVQIKLPTIDTAGLQASINLKFSGTVSKVSTKSFNASERFEVQHGEASLPCEGTDHNLSVATYVDKAGMLTTTFAVDLLTDSIAPEPAVAWRRGGMYGGKPDPALVLPARFTYESKEDVWYPASDRWSATHVRGVRLWDDGAKSWSSQLLAQDASYKVHVPLYNASFKDAGGVKVALGIRKYQSEEIVREKVDEIVVKLGGWPDNKATAVFDLPSAVLSSLPPDNYDLVFVVDPDNEIDELHEKWGKESEGGDPGGNNEGRIGIGLWSARPMFISGDAKNREMVYADGSTTPVPVTKAESAAATAGEEGLTLWFEPIRDDDARTSLSVAEFREELAKQTKAFHAYGWARYDGRGPVTGLHVTVSHLEGDRTRHIIARKVIPALYPGKAYPFSFIVDPNTLEKEKFVIDVTGPGVSLSWSHGDEQTTPDGGSSSGGGCTASSLGALVLLLAMPLFRHMLRYVKIVKSRRPQGRGALCAL